MNATIVRVSIDNPCTMTVSSISEAQGQYGPQLRFDGQDDTGTAVAVFEKVERADEQLRRAGMDRDSVIGRTITLYKETAQGNGRTFPALRISVADSGARPAVRAAAAAPPSAAPTNGDKLSAAFSLYDRCFTHAHSVAKSQGITDPQAIAAMAATIYIQANR